MSIKVGDYVRVRPSACKGVRCLDPEVRYRVKRAESEPPLPMRIRGKVWNPPHTVTLEVPGDFTAEQKTRWKNLVEVHIEDCAPADLVPSKAAPSRRPVDRVAVLLRLRRDHCLKHGRYPTIDQGARQEAREQARALFYADSRGIWDFADEMNFLVEAKLAAFGLKPEDVSDLGTLGSNKAIDGLIDSLKSPIRDTMVREYLLDKDEGLKQRDLAKHQPFGYVPRMFPKG